MSSPRQPRPAAQSRAAGRNIKAIATTQGEDRMSNLAYRQDEQEARAIARIAGQLPRETAENSYAQASELLDIMRSNAVDLATARQYMADEQALREEEIAAQNARMGNMRTYHARTGYNCSHGPDEHATC